MLGKWYAFVVYLQRFQFARSEKPDGLFNITNQSKLTHMAKTFISLLSDFGFKRIYRTYFVLCIRLDTETVAPWCGKI